MALLIFDSLALIEIDASFSLNETPPVFLLYVRQTWMIQLILEFSHGGLFSFNLKGLHSSYAR